MLGLVYNYVSQTSKNVNDDDDDEKSLHSILEFLKMYMPINIM